MAERQTNKTDSLSQSKPKAPESNANKGLSKKAGTIMNTTMELQSEGVAIIAVS
jgi:hypothetical protein